MITLFVLYNLLRNHQNVILTSILNRIQQKNAFRLVYQTNILETKHAIHALKVVMAVALVLQIEFLRMDVTDVN